MNIFHLHSDPKISAIYHFDKHVVKMSTEYCQILSTVCHYHGIHVDGLYKPTHYNHPVVVWARSSKQNFKFLLDLAKELHLEYTFRYEKIHKCAYTVIPVIESIIDQIPLGENRLTTLATAITGKTYNCKTNSEVIAAYRDLYQNGKSRMASWKKRNKPTWYKLKEPKICLLLKLQPKPLKLNKKLKLKFHVM